MKPKATATIGSLLLVIGLAACGQSGDPSPAPMTSEPIVVTPTNLPDATATPSALPTEPQPTSLPLASATHTPPAAAPTIPPPPTATLGPFEHTIAADETLGYIVQQYGYGYDVGLFLEIVQINSNMVSADLLPPPGNVILIPRQTATPVPAGLELTLESDSQLGLGERVGDVVLPAGATTGCYTVSEGDTIVSIAEVYSTNLEVLSQLNRDLYWFGCDFTQYSGGPGCNPVITVGQCINVPMPTPVPTSTPTPSGSETPTATPTHATPLLVYPGRGQTVSGVSLTLQWVGFGRLNGDEQYLVEFSDLTTGQQWLSVTDRTAVRLPVSLAPAPGQTNQVDWRVSVARPNASGVYERLGDTPAWTSFTWQGT
jgi:hypothetical protein